MLPASSLIVAILAFYGHHVADLGSRLVLQKVKEVIAQKQKKPPTSVTIQKPTERQAGRKDEQVLVPNTFAQWDWRVTPLQHGTLHLLLYVTPMLYVDGVGQGLRQLPQPPRLITVSPDYIFEIESLIVANWAICATLLTVIVVPLFLWLIRKSRALRENKPQKDAAGFAP